MLPPSRRSFESIKFLFACLNGPILQGHEENQRIGDQQFLKVLVDLTGLPLDLADDNSLRHEAVVGGDIIVLYESAEIEQPFRTDAWFPGPFDN